MSTFEDLTRWHEFSEAALVERLGQCSHFAKFSILIEIIEKKYQSPELIKILEQFAGDEKYFWYQLGSCVAQFCVQALAEMNSDEAKAALERVLKNYPADQKPRLAFFLHLWKVRLFADLDETSLIQKLNGGDWFEEYTALFELGKRGIESGKWSATAEKIMDEGEHPGDFSMAQLCAVVLQRENSEAGNLLLQKIFEKHPRLPESAFLGNFRL